MGRGGQRTICQSLLPVGLAFQIGAVTTGAVLRVQSLTPRYLIGIERGYRRNSGAVDDDWSIGGDAAQQPDDNCTGDDYCACDK